MVGISANNTPYFLNTKEGQARWIFWAAPRGSYPQDRRRAVLAGQQQSLSHWHFHEEPELPEDMTKEHPERYVTAADVRMINLMRQGRMKETFQSPSVRRMALPK